MRLDDVEPVNWNCLICDQTYLGTPIDAMDHLRGHGYEVERWPDGQPVVDMSQVPELLEEQ